MATTGERTASSKRWWPCHSYQKGKYDQCLIEALSNEVSGTLLEFADYVSSTWISGSTWKPTDWTCCKQAIRTNNDIEGWHHGLNRLASGRTQLPLYLLIQLLHREARLTAIQIRLVSEKKLRRIQQRKYRELQQRIFELWLFGGTKWLGTKWSWNEVTVILTHTYCVVFHAVRLRN